MNRRSLLSATAAIGTAACSCPSSLFAADHVTLESGDVILFQGDSITDAGRNKKSPVANQGLGRGYPKHIADSLHADYPDLDLQIHNRGISGNKVPDLDGRWQADCLEIRPKILSILIGVNDIWHRLNGRYDGTPKSYRDGLAALLDRTKKSLNDTTLVICEPFVLMSGTVEQNRDKWFPEFTIRREYAKEVAVGAGAIWVPFQTMFDEAVANGTSAKALAGDGVHPTQLGHKLMADSWRKEVGV